jgi:hypothetical protein
MPLIGKKDEKEKWPGHQRNPLERIVLDKQIQENPSFFLGKTWRELGLAWLGFERFGGDLKNAFGRSQGGGRANLCAERAVSCAQGSARLFTNA